MLKSLYVEAARKKGSIKEISPDLKSNDMITNNWNELSFDTDDKFSIGAGDGSFNKKKFMGYNFYAVAAESLIYDGELKKIENYDLDLLEHLQYTDELLSYYMSIFELKNAFRAVNELNVDYYLVDGSIYGDLQNPYPRGIELSKKVKEEILEESLDELKRRLNEHNQKVIVSQKLVNHFYKETYVGKKYDYLMFLCSIEKLLVLKDILTNSKNIIAISKSSDNNDIFKSRIPDLAIFDNYTKKEGISNLIYKDVSKKIKQSFPVEDDFFNQLTFTIFYLRLADNKNVLKVELPYKASFKEVVNLVGRIKKFSTGGYPFLLKKTHKDVVISNRNMDELLKIMHIHEKSGREMLK